MKVVAVSVTSDEEKFRSCPDFNQEAFERWFPVRGITLRVFLPSLKANQISTLKTECDSWFWKVLDEDKKKVRDTDDVKGRWVCEHCLDID